MFKTDLKKNSLFLKIIYEKFPHFVHKKEKPQFETKQIYVIINRS